MNNDLEKDIDNLRRCLNPERVKMNIIEQCRIVYEAINNEDSEYYGDRFKLRQLIGVGNNKLDKMIIIHNRMHQDLKEWFKGTDYQMNTAYRIGSLPHKAQLEWLYEVEILEGKHI